MTQHLDCVCVIHGDAYPWIYVENLFGMLSKHVSVPVRLHVFTEAQRSVPDRFIKHELAEWPSVSNTKRAWWYKMQIFDPAHAFGRVLYFDLDVVICQNLDWIHHLDTQYFWAIHDWRHLWRPQWRGINSSMMYWDHAHTAQVWTEFQRLGLHAAVRAYHGDQDLLSAVIDQQKIKYFDPDLIKSWRWQIKDGGMDPKTRRYSRPNTGSIVPANTAVMVFHGRPKPHEIQDTAVTTAWNISAG